MIARMNRRSSPEQLAMLHSALADVTRLRLLNLMRGREVCVCYFVEILGESQPKISRHLAYLRRAGIVKARREGKWMHYRMERPKDETVARVLDAVLEGLVSDRRMQSDLERLDKACCRPEGLVGLEDAPRPVVVQV